MNTGIQDSAVPFQKCGSCGQSWIEWRDFVMDPGTRLLGFQAVVSLPDANLLVFEHKCGSTISILVKRLRPFFPETPAEKLLPLLFGTDGCSQRCSELQNLEACDRECSNARDRRIIQHLMKIKAGIAATENNP